MEKLKEFLKEIEHKKLEGYIWMSDSKNPIVFSPSQLNDWKTVIPQSVNPFIIEGLLFCHEDRSSYSIRFIDGEYHIGKFIATDDKQIFTERTYLPSFQGAKALRMRLYWNPEKDSNCLNMEVLQPAHWVFMGFEQ